MSEFDVPLATFWDRNGVPQELESFPKSFQHWELGQPLNDSVQQVLLQRLESVLAKNVVRTELRAVERNLVSRGCYPGHPAGRSMAYHGGSGPSS